MAKGIFCCLILLIRYRTDIAFRLVDFDTRKDYETAMDQMQDSVLDGNTVTIHFDVRLFVCFTLLLSCRLCL